MNNTAYSGHMKALQNHIGARGGVVVKALGYQPAGRGTVRFQQGW